MKKEKLIEKVLRSESLVDSEELLNWIKDSDKNHREYIRFKNIWALLQRGKEMKEEVIVRDFEKVQAKLTKTKRKYRIWEWTKYAAIIIMVFLGGYYFNALERNQEVAMNEIKVPSGNRTSIQLPDGTNVWLTNNSKLIYPERFNGKQRNVSLIGEAFFNVAHNSKEPFIVELGGQRVKVLGTKFSVVSYPEDNEIQVDLVSGKVQFDIDEGDGKYLSYHLDPLQRIIYNKESGKIKSDEVQDNFFNYWFMGVYEFENESFESLAKKIERIYGVKIVLEDDRLNKRLFTGTLNIDDNIYTMMEVFKQASGQPFKFSIDQGRIYIKPVN